MTPPFAHSTEVYYDNIDVGQNDTISFSGGGIVHIDKLEAERNATINFAAGTYFIDELILERGVNINVTSSPVYIHVGTDANFGRDVDINQGGSVTDFILFLHDGVGIVLKPQPGTSLESSTDPKPTGLKSKGTRTYMARSSLMAKLKSKGTQR